MEAAFWRALRVTLAGSTTPALEVCIPGGGDVAAVVTFAFPHFGNDQSALEFQSLASFDNSPYNPGAGHLAAGANGLLLGGNPERLQFKAPNKEGEFEFVCTFLGHFMTMGGKVIVTKDVDGYLKSHPATAPVVK